MMSGPSNSNPDHAIRLLQDMASYDPNKTVYCESHGS